MHCLLTEGGFSDDGFWRVVKHFNYTYLRMAFQTALLNEMEKRIGPSFKKTKAAIYHKNKNGFYVYAKPSLCDPDTVVKYISRYLGRPVIATSRIDSYDGTNVTFHYNKHEDNSYVVKTIPVLDFMKLLIQHIPEKHFKMTRYYGLYARHREADRRLCKAVPKSKHKILLDFNRWRTLFLLSWNPHIHCLLTEGGFSDDGFWRVVKHFNYTYLRMAFQTALLNEMEKRIGPSFKKTKAAIYHKNKNGFYVYAKPSLCDPDTVVKYISRYLCHVRMPFLW
nr:transposase [Clostridium sp. Marseille-P2415]